MKKSYGVTIIVDPAFGAKLFDLSNRLPVWICSTPVNLETIKEAWPKGDKKHSLELGVTTFKVKEGDSPEGIFLGIIDDVDLHHGEYSHTPPWSVLEVYGTNPSIKIKLKLEEYGQGSFAETEEGFIFTRKVEPPPD